MAIEVGTKQLTTRRQGSARSLRTTRLSGWLSLLLVLFGLLAIPGCSGCTQEPEDPAAAKKKKEDEEKKKKEKEEKPFEFGLVTIQPGARKTPSLFAKPGHWATATQRMIANKFDFVGEMSTAVIDARQEPYIVPNTPYRLSTDRPVALPKKQEKFIEMTFYVPPRLSRINVETNLESRSGAGEGRSELTPFQPMRPYQYYFAILSRGPDRFRPWAKLHSMSAPSVEIGRPYDQYTIVFPTMQKPVPLPSHALAWTSTAHFLWDDADPTTLSIEQQEAMIDWLHWGGNLIINGPTSLQTLRGTFLAPYLPAEYLGLSNYAAEDVKELSEAFSLPGRSRRTTPTLRVVRPWSGITVKKHEYGVAIPGTDGLLIERRVGRGRVVVSAINLSQPEFINWRGFDNFMNATLLRRPNRKYVRGPDETAPLVWAADGSIPDDPRRTTSLRYFSRDAGTSYDVHGVPETNFDQNQYGGFNPYNQPQRSLEDELAAEEAAESEQVQGGVASWNPASGAANAARTTLRESAGINIPEPFFVVKVVGLYLLVLVPVNWLLFWSLGRVEWAWFAAPVVAVVFSLLVVRFAQLDIGFARSQTEICVLEVQGDYPRGHLTRYTALYTSLATRYELEFNSATAVALPFSATDDFRQRPGQGYSTVEYRRGDEVHLTGLSVASNSTGMVHSEQMFELGGPIRLGHTESGGLLAFNGSNYPMTDVIVMRRVDHGSNSLEISRLGALERNGSQVLQFEPFDEGKNPQLFLGTTGDQLPLERMQKLASAVGDMEPGEIRLLGRIDQELPGYHVIPATNQLRTATLVVAHLKYPNKPDPKSDENTVDDVPTGFDDFEEEQKDAGE